MKKLLPIAIACLFAISTQAQTTPANNTTTKSAPAPAPAKQAAPKQTSSKDCLMMKDGKMWVMKGGTSTAMTSDMTLTNGTKVMADGSCMTKDGKKMMMKNGDCMGMDGKMMKKAAPKKAAPKK